MFGITRTIINIIFGIIEVLLGIRLIFKLLGANVGAPFVSWIYGATSQLVAPFSGIIPNWNISGFVIDFSTLIALVIYSLVGYFLLEIFSYSGSRYTRA